ncbi:MAG: hypothetical protein WCL18_07560 [bacterium]
MFDLVKLQSVNNNYLSKISTDELYNQSMVRAERYKPELSTLIKSDVSYVKAALNIERLTPKDPKRFTTYTDIETQLRFFFDTEREKLRIDHNLSTFNFPLSIDVLKSFVSEYVSVLDLDMSVEEWFAQLKEI